MTAHENLTGDALHGVVIRPYVDIAARDADTSFQVAASINSVVRVNSPLSCYLLLSVNPAVWLELSNTTSDSFLKMLDTFSSFAEAAGQSVQVNAAENALELGQALGIFDSPQFDNLTIDDSVTVGFDLEVENNLTVRGEVVDFNVGSLATEAKVLTLANVNSPTNFTANAAGIVVKGGTDKSILWQDSANSWVLNQDVVISGSLTVQGLSTILNSTVLRTQDKNVELAAVPVPNDITAEGGGITLRGDTDKTILWLSATDAWTFNKNVVALADLTVQQDLVVIGDLTVQGTTVTLDSTTLLIEDKNIELGNVAVPTDITADGGGITLKGATDKTILWVNATDSWDFNQKVIAQVGLQVIGDLNNFGLNGNPDSFAAGTGALDATTTASRNVAIGKNAGGSLLTGSDNYFLGFAAGTAATSSNFNVGIGKSSLTSLTTGDNNIAVGEQTLQAVKTTSRNVALGANALKKHVVSDTVAVGFNALLNNTSGTLNTVLGHEALGNNISASGSTAVGHHAMKFTIAGFNTAVGADAMTGAVGLPTVVAVDNVAVGAGALNAVTSGSRNVAIGRLALTLGTVTKSNIAVGFNALASDISGDFNVALGEGALQSLTVADDNIAIGFAALQNVMTGIDNIGIGCFVGEGIVTGSRNILIGEEANFATDVSDMLNIGNSMFLSMATSNFLGLGVPSPTSSIHIQRAGQTEIALETYSAVNSIPVLSFKRSDGATVGTHAAVDAGDILGLVDFHGSNGTIFLSGAHMLATAEETFTATSAATSLRFFTAPVGSVIPLERMAITPSGNVGIGAIPDASAKLDVASTTKGFLPPRMTTTQIDAISAPAAGLIVYDTIVDKYEIFTPTVRKTLLTEDLGTVVAQETFASTNVRFFGELALPATQGWTDTATGSTTIDLFADTVFGESKQVVRHNDNVGNGSTTSLIVLTLQNWTDIRDFGASFSGISRLDAVSGAAGFFVGLQADAADNPLATGNRRYGLTFADVLGNLRITEPSGTTITFDGTGGSPLVASDEFFSWECVVPAGLGAAEFYINRILTTFAPTFITNAGGLGTSIRVSSGSTGGIARVTYHDNFGVTIFEETATKTLLAATMAGDVAQINIPEGKRDYTIILPDGNPRAIGATLRLVANNVLGLISLENQNPAAPEVLYNGLRTLVLEIAVKEVITGVNTVNLGNVYLGFKDEDIDRAKSIFAQLSSSVDQVPVDTNPTIITYNTQDEINGIGHSTSLNPGELEILPGFGGVYFVQPQAQVGKDSGGVKTDFDMFWQIDRGSGFVDEPNSNIKLTIKDSDITDVIVSGFNILLNAGDKIRMLQRVSTSTVGLGLKNTDPVVEPPTRPRVPSIILAMHRVGGAP